MKKILIILSFFVLVFNSFLIPTSYSVDTNGLSSPWTLEKSSHLARKALYGATPEKVMELLNAGSAEDAVNILFPSIEGPDRTDFNLKMQEFGDVDLGNSNNRNKFYMAKKFLDPYEAKSKLFTIFEDTFSVNISSGKDITISDIESTHDLLYNYTLGNYKEMIKRNLYNNGEAGDYSLSQFLDLLDQTDPKKPNENYSREVLQLFLMLEYIPTESETTGDKRNYTEEDVHSLALILFGFQSNEENHSVTYNNNLNTNKFIDFLDGDLKNGDNFDFYNSGSGIIDIQKLKEIRNGNNGLPDNIIDYIFSKREYEISMFLADKLYRSYIAEKPTKNDLDLISDEIRKNNFEIYPTIKWLLSSDLMYSDKSMNSIIYKNPLELSIGTYKKLGLNVEDIDTSTLTDLEWSPYLPGSIFGRQGFDENNLFFKANNATKWIKQASIISNKVDIDSYIDVGTGSTAEKIVDNLINKIYLGRKLDETTRNKLIKFLTTDEKGDTVEVNLEDVKYKNYYLKSLIGFLIIQPEFILLSGNDLANSEQGNINNFYTDDSKLIIIKSYGGTDWLHNIVPKDEYKQYLENRGSGALIGNDLTSLDDKYYINSSMTGFVDLYKSGNLKIINRVGTPNHSRGHDSASRKITSQNNLYSEDEGIIGHFIKNENPVKTMVMGTRKPLELRSGKYLNITSNTIYSIADSTNNDFREYKINTIKDIYNSRLYPSNLTEVFKNSVIINDVSKNSQENGGRPGSGYNMEQNFAFIEGLFDSNITNVVSMSADGGYDTHRNQKDYLTNNLRKVSKATSEYFNKVKDKQDITIVIYSEFGRTNKINASLGTDHGMGGGMFILTNNKKLEQNLPNSAYGNLSFKDAESNWLGVGIDYRSVYTSILDSLYDIDISEDLKGKFDINSYIDDKKPDVESLNISYSKGSGNRNKVKIEFNINDTNFKPTEASYIKFEYGKEKENMYEYSSYSINRYMKLSEDNINLYISNTDPGKKYYYKITLFDNQYNKEVIEGSFISPNIKTDTLDLKGNSRLSNFENTTLSGSLKLENESSSGIVLSNSGTLRYSLDEKNSFLASSGTYITEVTGSGELLWDGTFILPQEINNDYFIKKDSKYKDFNLADIKIDKLIKVGSDKIGVGLKLNKEVGIEIKDINSNKKYIVITSQDGLIWNKINNIKIQNNILDFKTDHFSFFAVVESNDKGEPKTEKDNVETKIIKSTHSSSGTPKLIKDVCPYGDFSYSYYDRTCGIDPSLLDPSHGRIGNLNILNMYNDLRNDLNIEEVEVQNDFSYAGVINEKQAQLAYMELKLNKEEEKIEVYEDVFNKTLLEYKENVYNKIDEAISLKDQKEVLLLLREKLSYTFVGDYSLIHIKNSEINEKFEKIANILINKNYSKEKTDKLLYLLNKIVIYFAIHNLEGITQDLKEKNNILLKDSIKELVGLYKSKRYTKTNTNIKNKTKKETIQEKIDRINNKIKEKQTS